MKTVKNTDEESIKNAVTFLDQSKIDCPALNWKKEKGDGVLDFEMIPLLKELNKLSFLHTTGSCAGHSISELKNPHKGWGINIPYRVTLALHVNVTELKTFSHMIREMIHVTKSNMWCEYGYQDDYNNKTESDYIPIQIVIFAGTKQKRDRCLEKLYITIKEFVPNQNKMMLLD